MSNWMSLEDACEEIGVSRSTMDKWRSTGRGPAFRKLPSGKLRIKRVEFDAWLDDLKVAA
jgi:excisionase family DNA binding protein